ncbi:MAG: hypothetical protein JXO22_13340 [Phycisphaerae bacterium]|nr:hypothetical protein [Phycisphaerae bacterium]
MTTNDAAPLEQARQRQKWLTERRREHKAHRAELAARETSWTWARLGLFCIALASWLVVGFLPLVTAWVTALAIVLFVVAIRGHHRAKLEREAADRLLLMIDESLQRVGGQICCIRSFQRPPEFAEEEEPLPAVFECGRTWALTDQERDDLDLYGEPVGIFGLLNRTSSAVGARRLRGIIENPGLDAERIVARQDMVRWLSEHADERLDLMAALAALRHEDRHMYYLIHALRYAQRIPTMLPRGVMRVWSVLCVLYTVFAWMWVVVDPQGALQWLLIWAGTLVVNGVIAGHGRSATQQCLKLWGEVTWAARGFETAVRQAVEGLPEETELAGLRERCAAIMPPDALPALRRRTAWADSGGPMWEFANLVALVKLHAALRILDCAVTHRDALLAGISAIAELDAMCGMASFSWEQPVTCYPVPAAQTLVRLTNGHHPLVPSVNSVPNDVELTPEMRLWVVTGSNMAGKSTFLRMAGVNILLAQIGCAATAEAMTWSPLCLITDLRARDNLADNESYFLAEVRHLRRLLFTPENSVPLLGLIDEPFRGTNSHDQSAASVAVVRHLLESRHLLLVATHDQHLTKLANGGPARNYHFRENLDSAALVFDYRLHQGPAQTRNALRILEREGYPPEVVETARNWLGD